MNRFIGLMFLAALALWLAGARPDVTALAVDDAPVTQVPRTQMTQDHGVYCVAFSPDGKTLASTNGEGTIIFWDAATGKEQTSLQGPANYKTSVEFSPDGKTLASVSDEGRIRLWNAASGKEWADFQAHGSEVWALAFSPDGKTLASGSYRENIVKLWGIRPAK